MNKNNRCVALFLLIAVMVAAFFLRTYNVNWDDFRHVHPDERMIIMVTEQIHWPVSAEWEKLFTPESPLNPRFFAYGSFPIYLLRIVAGILSLFDSKLITYDYINLIGRTISAIFDTLTVFLIFCLGKKIKDQKTGLLAALFYTFAVFPIQAAHFYAVDVMLTFFILLTLYFIIDYERRQKISILLKISIVFGLAMAIKVSAILLVVPVALGLLMGISVKKKSAKAKVINLIFAFGGVILLAGATFAICEPYALIDFPTFWSQTQAQSQMTKNAFAFPYTLQYVGTIPYLYHLKNMILWGMGILLGAFSVIGLILVSCQALNSVYHKRMKEVRREIILLSFFWLYFFSVGSFAIKFMRYFLPLYPLFILFAAYFFITMMEKNHKLKIISFIIIIMIFFYGVTYSVSFLAVYSLPHVRVTASDWMINNIPAGSVVLREHWDDGMPMWGGERFQSEELKMYDADSEIKWQEINGQLSRADYIVIASNRLYTPLQKLVNCGELPEGRCYARTATYYQQLFNGELGFDLAAEFSSYPTIPFINLPINDQEADESFTVYDHPKIMIFKKVRYN